MSTIFNSRVCPRLVFPAYILTAVRCYMLHYIAAHMHTLDLPCRNLPFRDPSEMSRFVRMHCSFDARSNEELSPQNGDLVELVSERLDADDGWWTGVI